MVVTTATAAFAATTTSPKYTPWYRKTLKNDKVVVYESNNATLVSVSTKRLSNNILRLGSRFEGTVKDQNTGVKYTLTSIGANAVAGTKATVIKLGPKVRKLNRRAFSNAKNLKKLYFRGAVAVSVNKKAFQGLKKTQLSKISVFVSAKMSAEDFENLKASLVACGLKASRIKQVTGQTTK